MSLSPEPDTNLLLQALQAKSNFKEEDFERLLALMELRSFKKNEMIFNSGELVKANYFILKGCTRQYYINPSGTERTLHFAEEGYWAGDTASTVLNIPTEINLQALEDTTALALGREKTEYAIRHFPEFAVYQFKNHAFTIALFKSFLGQDVNQTPEDKYLNLMKQRPALLMRLPQYHIARHLGITPETLSRIRKKLATR